MGSSRNRRKTSFEFSRSRLLQAGGLGLGLAIARHLIELQGGQISAHSGGQHTGTTISMRLPVNPTAASDITRDTTLSVTDVRLDGVTVLVVDDQADSREMLATLLEHGAHSMQSESAESALQILQLQRVDLLIADIAMPNVDVTCPQKPLHG